MRQKTESSNATAAESVIKTSGKIFPDGNILELISTGSPPDEIQLLLWDGEQMQIASRIEFGGAVYVPMPLTLGTRRAMRLPGQPARFGSIRELFGKIARTIAANSVLRPRESSLLAFFVIASWFSDLLPATPCVLLRGRSQAAASRLLRILASLCRRALNLTELTPSSLLGLPLELRPTLLLNQFAVGRTLAGLLRPSTQAGAFVSRSGDFLELGGARPIFAASNHLDPSATEGMLQIPIPFEERVFPLLDMRAADQIATQLQPELLDYRLRFHQRVRNSSFDAPSLTPETREVARSLGAAIVDDAELAAELIDLLAAQDQDSRARTSLSPESALVFAILTLLHERKSKSVLVQELAKIVNTILRAKGEITEFCPSEVGYRLRAMALFTHRTAAGQALRLDRELSVLIHELAPQFGISMPPGGFPECPDCGRSSYVPENRMLME